MPTDTDNAFEFDTPALVAYTSLPATFWYAKADAIPHYFIARKLFWRKADIDAFIAKHLVTAADDNGGASNQ